MPSLLTGIVGYWKLDGNSNDSVASANGTDTAITYSAGNGIIIQGAGMNGTTSLINLGTGLAVTGGLSINLWVKTSSLSASGMLFGKSNALAAATDSYYMYGARISNTQLQVQCFAGDGTTNKFYNSPTTVTVSSFTMLTMTYDLTNFRVYANGTLLDTSGALALSAINTAASRVNIGAYGAIPSLFFNGAIDEVGLWQKALSGAEITALYNSGAGLQYPFSAGFTPTPMMHMMQIAGGIV